MIGTFLRKRLQLWREIADIGQVAHPGIAGIVRHVQGDAAAVVRSPRSAAARPERYPSPYGRTGYPQGRPPMFFCYNPDAWSDRQGFAGRGSSAACRFHSARAMSQSAPGQTSKGQDTTCRSNTSFLPLRRQARLRPAATRRSSSHCLGPGPARRVRPFWTPTWPAAHWSVPLAMSHFVNATHRGVDATLSRVKSAAPSSKGYFPLYHCSTPEEKNRGIEHENGKISDRDGIHRGSGRVFNRAGNVQSVLFQPGARAAAGHRLTPAAPVRARITAIRKTRNCASHTPGCPALFCVSDHPRKRDSACSTRS